MVPVSPVVAAHIGIPVKLLASLIVLGIFAVAAVITAIVRASRKPPVMGAAPPVCPTCRTPIRWVPESNAWGCDRCRQLLPPR